MSTALLIVLIIIGVLIALVALALFLKVRFTLEYDEELEMGLYIGPVKLKHVFDKKDKDEEKPEKESGERKLMKTVRLIIKLLRHFKGRVTISQLQLYCTVGSENPMKAALLYGGGWAVLGNIVGLLDKEFIITHQDCQMFCVYQDMETKYYIKLQLYTRVWKILRAGKPDFLSNDDKTASPQAASG